MKIKFLPFILVAAIVFSAQSAAQSMLRVICLPPNQGADVLVDGKFKGECPIDIQVPAGTIRLRVEKKTDPLRERMFEQDVRIGDGVVKKIEVELTERLTAEGQRAEAEQKKTAAIASSLKAEDLRWKRALGAATTQSMNAYLEQYPQGRFVDQARQKIDEYKAIPARPELSFKMNEDAWKVLESSEHYRNYQKTRPIVIKSEMKVEEVDTSSNNASNTTPALYTEYTRSQREPISDRCEIFSYESAKTMLSGERKPPQQFKSYLCAGISIGHFDASIIHDSNLVSITGSMFPLRLGNRWTSRSRNSFAVNTTKLVFTNDRSCEVIEQTSARELNSKLSGIAWKIRCANSSSSDLEKSPTVTSHDDYFLGDFGTWLGEVTIFDEVSEKHLVPSAGSKLVTKIKGSSFSYRYNKTVVAHEVLLDGERF